MMEKILQCMHDICNKLSSIFLSAKLMQKTCEKCPKRVLCGGCPNLPMLDSIIASSKAIKDLVTMHRQYGKEMCEQNSQIIEMHHQLEDGPFRYDILRLGKENQLEITIDNRLPVNTFILLNLDTKTEGIQILNNLFFNAKKANAANVRIVAVDLEDHIALRFIDDGDGMTAETIACLGLSVASKTSTGEGTGILKKLAIQSNGTIEWSSAGIGAGCCVTLRFIKHGNFEIFKDAQEGG